MEKQDFSMDEFHRFLETLPCDISLAERDNFETIELELTGVGSGKLLKSNSERCRKYREKRRQEEQNVYRENAELKQEREEFQRKIIDLEMQVQALRGQGVVDLSKENELLRKEIQKHKNYIETIVRVTKETPLDIEEEEEERLMKSGLESSAAQIVGFLYSSMTDSSWKSGESFTTASIFPVTSRYQFIPTGSDHASAKRVNARIDIQNIPICADKLAKYIWALNKAQRIQKVRSTVFKKGEIPEIQAEEVHQIRRNCNSEEDIKCTRILVPKDDPKLQIIFVRSRKIANIFPSAFEQNGLCDIEYQTTSQKCHVITNTTTDVNIKSIEDKNLERIDALCLDGFVLRESANDVSTMTHIVSVPLDDSISALHPKEKRIVDENGSISDLVKAAMELHVLDLLRAHNSIKLK